jgi:hypothetical protein
MSDTRRPLLRAFTAAVALAIAAFANIVLAGMSGESRLAAWLVTVASIFVLCASIGMAIAGSWTGVIESARNRVSLSRLQMLLWTVLVLSAFVTAAASNISDGASLTALQIKIPGELLAAMGIAATSLAAAPALLSLKAGAAAGAPPVTNTGGEVVPEAGVSNAIHARSDIDSASWLDIFRGDEVGNCDTPDLSKIQQFLITIVLVGGYGCVLGAMFAGGGAIRELPPLDDNFVWLLGISHAGYLVYKAVPHPSARAGAAAASVPAASGPVARPGTVPADT